MTAVRNRLAKLEQRQPTRDDSLYLECLAVAGRGGDLLEVLGVEIEPVTELTPHEESPYRRALWQQARDAHLQCEPDAPVRSYTMER
jgi:hypothetical protein